MSRIFKGHKPAGNLAVAVMLCISLLAVLIGLPSIPDLPTGDDGDELPPPFNGEGTFIPEPICHGATDECPGVDQVETYRSIIDKLQPFLRAFASPVFGERQQAQKDLSEYLLRQSGDDLREMLTILRCLKSLGLAKLEEDKEKDDAEVIMRANFAVEEVTSVEQAGAVFHSPGVSPICGEGDPPLLILDSPYDDSCHTHTEVIKSPGGASCYYANIAIRAQISRHAQTIEEEIASCSQYVTPAQGTQDFIKNVVGPSECCVDKDRCQFVTDEVRADYMTFYRSLDDQKTCFEWKCEQLGGHFIPSCEPDENFNGAIFRYGVPDTCSEYDDKRASCCEGLPEPTLAPPTPTPSPDITPEPSPEPSSTHSPVPTGSMPSPVDALTANPNAVPSWVPF